MYYEKVLEKNSIATKKKLLYVGRRLVLINLVCKELGYVYVIFC